MCVLEASQYDTGERMYEFDAKKEETAMTYQVEDEKSDDAGSDTFYCRTKKCGME